MVKDVNRRWFLTALTIGPVAVAGTAVAARASTAEAATELRDAQRLYNYWASVTAEKIALEPKAPFIVSVNQLEGFKAAWDAGPNLPYLPYKP